MSKSVKEVMGLVQLQVMWFSSDRTLYKYVNDPLTSYPAHSKWKKFKNQMGKGNYYAILTETKDAPGSKSGYSYNIIGVLAKFNFEDEAQQASHINHQAVSDCYTNWDKLQATLRVAESIKTWCGEEFADDFNMNTYLLLQLIAEGGLKEARKLSKEFL